MSDGELPDEPMRRPRGRHAVPTAGAAAAAGRRAPLAAVTAFVESRVSAAGAWLFERRLHVLIVTATVATVGMIGGTVALISLTGAQQPDDGAVTVVGTDRPTATDPGTPTSYAPILPSPGPPPSISPTDPAAPPEDLPVDPVTGAPVEPPTEPEAATQPPRPETAPGATNRPDKPDDPDKPADPEEPEDPDPSEECNDPGLLDLLLNPRCR